MEFLDQRSESIARKYWAAHLGCPEAGLFAEPLRIIHHGRELADYRGAAMMFRRGNIIVSIPAGDAAGLKPILDKLYAGITPSALAATFEPVAIKIIGPACIGYAGAITAPSNTARLLTESDSAAYEEFKGSLDETEWEHGGSRFDQPCSAVFHGELITALAGYEVWGGEIAHIAIVTRPELRGRGFGQSAVAHNARHAIRSGLLPQYRTLESNSPSIRIAERLGFLPYATAMAVRLGPAS